MKDFFNVTPLAKVFEYIRTFPVVASETIPIVKATGRVLAQDIRSDEDVPGFSRSTMDGYAVCAASTFGASEGNPAYLTLDGVIPMGENPSTGIVPGNAIRISTGGMLPNGADSVVMMEYATEIDETTLEIHKSIAPGANMITKGEDVQQGQSLLSAGTKLRPQEIGLLAALGIEQVAVYKKPVVGIISTGDEIVPIQNTPGLAQVRDINSYSISSQVVQAGGIALSFGIIKDNYDALIETYRQALQKTDMLTISGGSSVGTRDLTIEVLKSLNDSKILVHGIPISPGKPTILARVGNKPVWGLPGHVTSAMVVFDRVVRPFIAHAAGINTDKKSHTRLISAKISRNIASAQGRTDFVRVKLRQSDDGLWAEPVLGKSGLINTMVQADGLVEIDMNTEGLDKGTAVSVIPF
ncbi:MAG: molybdopterin molybdotransferase MoeA [Desulfobacteraceae bacterium]|nr:molybdopterin molybdotransferase MoeA [Desulfobacteraceae bacterium]MBC2756064.1 molybdopterin molybdotransferase MoeA [Desulfobacteraceae bacterium]